MQDTNNTEVWKDVIEFEGHYEISSIGRVKSVARKILWRRDSGNNHYRYRDERIIKLSTNKYGYKFCALRKPAKGKSATIHRLVALSFIDNPQNKPCVNHINGDRGDNRVENLEWVTVGENVRHSNKNLRLRNNYKRKIVLQMDLYGNNVALYFSISEAERQTGLSKLNISRAMKRDRNISGGYRWKEVKDIEIHT